MYHITDTKKYIRCPRLFVLETQAEKQEYRPYVRLDEEITALAAEKLHVSGEIFTGARGDESQKAVNALETADWLIKARFEHGGLRIKVPFLHRTEEGWEIYFLFAGLYPHANDMHFYTSTAWVLKGCGIEPVKWHVIHLNADYVRGQQLDTEELFIISDSFYNSSNNPTKPVKETIEEAMRDMTGTIAAMDQCLENEMPAPARTQNCTGRQKCRHYSECFPNEKQEDDNSILTLIGARYRYEMKKNGMTRLGQAELKLLEGTRQQYAQVMADRNADGLFIDRAALRAWLDSVTFPVTFLDFEWERFAVPPYEGMKPYDVLPFEYSIDILYEDGKRDHKVYLSVGDDRREMAEQLIRDIPKEGSVVAYNAEGAEKIRIRELADLYEDLHDDLMAMNERMEDLQLPFESGTVYDVRMRGQWSLKILMSMMDDPGYHDLDIQQGMDAVFEWRHLDLSEDIENREQIIENLKAYCGMDSYAMTVVFEWLRRIDSSPIE